MTEELNNETALTSGTIVNDIMQTAIEYEMRNAATGELCAIGTSGHCFMHTNGKPIFMEKEYPEFYSIMKSHEIQK